MMLSNFLDAIEMLYDVTRKNKSKLLVGLLLLFRFKIILLFNYSAHHYYVII